MAAISHRTHDNPKQCEVMLPPMHISKLIDFPKEKGLEAKLERVIRVSSIVYGDHCCARFKKYSEQNISCYKVIAYVAGWTNSNAFFTACGKPQKNTHGEEESCSDEELGSDIKKRSDSEQHEFFFFFNSNKKQCKDIYVLSTSYAYECIKPYCANEFPSQLSRELSDNILKIEEIVTTQLRGPISESCLAFRGDLPVDIEQRGLYCRKIILIVNGYRKLMEGEVKVEFKDSTVLFYRRLSLSQYAELFDSFSKKKSENIADVNWGIDGIPSQFLPCKDKNRTKELDEKLIIHSLGLHDERIENCDFDFTVSHKAYGGAYEFRFHYVSIERWKGSYFVPLDPPYLPPTFGEIRYFLRSSYSSIPLTKEDKEARIDLLKNKHIDVGYCVNEMWLSHPILEYVEGFMRVESEMFFRINGLWQIATQDYQKEVNRKFSSILSENKVPERGELFLDWGKDIQEEAYSRQYLDHSNEKKRWFDGNRKRKNFGVVQSRVTKN